MFIPQKTDEQNQIGRPDRYVVYGWRRSYFTHKLTAALHFYGAPFEFRDKTKENEREIRLRSGTHQVPVLHTPENWMIADTTPLLRMLDARFPERALFPQGELGLLTQILEEYFDEWIARTTVHWRWNYPENHELLSMDAAHGDRQIAEALTVWGGKVCRATGVSSDIQQRAAEDEYHRIMAAAESQLDSSAFLLGERPTAVDCIVLAGLRAHFLYDPAPNRVLRDRYPRVVRWTEHTADQWDGGGALAPYPASTPFARFVLGEMKDTYARFALANRAALRAGDKAFVIPMYGEAVSYLARPYIEQSRRMIAARIESDLADGRAAAFKDQLAQWGLRETFSD